jgi:hypothetical protein
MHGVVKLFIICSILCLFSSRVEYGFFMIFKKFHTKSAKKYKGHKVYICIFLCVVASFVPAV